ncbi:MAG: glycosyltransferase [Muribaculaceae bacterium]|nr:glycosyltransferase [Muribaculaceae bacterium]
MNEANDIKISVIIPVYNVAEFLPRCLDSILGQSVREIEVICINDCTPDNSGTILDNYCIHDSRVRAIHKTVNEGPMKARETGYKEARGKYIFFCDGDDFLPENAFDTLLRLAMQSDADITVGNAEITGTGKKRVRKRNAAAIGTSWQSYLRHILNWGTPALWGILFKRSLFENVEYTAIAGMKQSEDRRLLTEILLKKKPSVTATDRVVYLYWINPHSTTRTKPSAQSILSQFESLFGSYYFIESVTSDFTAANDNQMLRYLSLYIENGADAAMLRDFNSDCRRLLRFSNMRAIIGLRLAVHTAMCMHLPLYATAMNRIRNYIRKMQGKS